MSLYRDVGVVLRTHKLGEADRIITVLTRGNGRIRAVGKGVRRTSSRFGSRLEPFTHVDLQLATARSLDIITQAEIIDAFGEPIVADYPRYTAGTAMLEMAEKLTDAEREPALQQYLLLVGGLRALAEQQRDTGLVLDSYVLRSLAVAGYAPSFDACLQCGRDGPQPYLNVAAGGAVCADCRPPGSVAPAANTMALLAALLSGDWTVAEVSQPRSRREASGIIAAYSQWHLERDVRSFRLVERG